MGTAIAMLTACGESPPADIPGAGPQSRTLATDAGHRGSWTLPLAAGEDLLYVSGQNQSVTKIYTFPGVKLVGSLSNSGSTGGLCSDRNGNVFITTQSAIYEYPHGLASPIATLTDPQPSAYGCSVDDATGNLAVISTYGGGDLPAGTAVRVAPSRSICDQSNRVIRRLRRSGNLFVDGRVTPNDAGLLRASQGRLAISVGYVKPCCAPSWKHRVGRLVSRHWR